MTERMPTSHTELLDELQSGHESDTASPPNAPVIRIILADSQAIYRVGMRKVFALEDDIRVVAQVDTIQNLHAAVQRFPSDIVMLEASLLADTTDAIPELVRLAPDTRIIVQA